MSKGLFRIQGHTADWALPLLFAAALIVVCVGAAMRELQHKREQRRAESERKSLLEQVRRLRNELGELTVEDPQRVNIVQAPQSSHQTWKWRIWIPAGKAYTLHAMGGEIPAQGFPQAMGVPVASAGEESWCEYSIRFNAVTRAWEQTLQVSQSRLEPAPGAPAGSDITWPLENTWWLDEPDTISSASSEGVGNFVHVVDPKYTITLRRYRATKSGEPTRPPCGFLVWLEPAGNGK